VGQCVPEPPQNPSVCKAFNCLVNNANNPRAEPDPQGHDDSIVRCLLSPLPGVQLTEQLPLAVASSFVRHRECVANVPAFESESS
jgi:hypothetical protein